MDPHVEQVSGCRVHTRRTQRSGPLDVARDRRHYPTRNKMGEPMKRIFKVCMFALMTGLPGVGLAQDSNDCTSFSWTKEEKLSSKISHHFRIENNCSWEVWVHWRSNEWGQEICGNYDSMTQIRAGAISRHWVTVDPEVTARLRWCAEAGTSNHPDWNTCPSKTC